MNRRRLLDACKKLGITSDGRVAEALEDEQALRIINMAEAGRRHARVDLERLDAAIKTLIDVRYDDEPTRSKARKALDAILAVDDPEDEEKQAEALDSHPGIVLTESTTPDGSAWEVLLIQPGLSGNRRRYRKEVLQAAVPLFEGVRSFAPQGGDHWGNGEYGKGRGPRELVGWFTNPAYREGIKVPGSDKVVEGITANYHVSEAAPWLRALLRDAWTRGKPDLIGYSIVGDGETKVVRGAGGRPEQDVQRVNAIESVDPVVHPAAGGMTLRLVASKEGHPVDWSKLTLAEAISGLAAGTILPDELRENRPDLSAQASSSGSSTSSPPDLDALIEAKFAERFAVVETAQAIEAKLSGEYVKAPTVVKDRVRETTKGQKLDEAAIDATIKAELAYFEKVTGKPAIVEAGGSGIEPGKSERERIADVIYEGLKDDTTFSIKGMYVDLTGDRSFSGKLAEGGRLTESLTTASFGEILGDSVTRRMLDYYNLPGLDAWRNIVSIERLTDFRTQRRIRYGGYPNLPTVAQGDPYTALTSPTDEEATYAPAKKGGTEDLTFETIVNDDLGALRDIPRRLGRAAAQTLYEFVFTFMSGNGNIYDGSALAVAGHANTGTAALDAAALSAGRLAMLKQADMSNSKRLGIQPRFLCVPADLEKTAYELTQTDREVGNANNTLNFIRTFGLSVIVVSYWTDVTNWWLVASPSDVPTINIGFLNGNESPELFLQDQPTQGAVFTNDKLTYKIRHIYGGAVMDYRGFYGALVAG